MNKDQFYKQLEQPQLLSRDDIDSLQELVEQYPYFASARILLAKALHSANDHRFDEALQMAAVFAGDRKVLYDLVMKENLKKKIRDLDEAVSQETDEIESEEVETPEVESAEEPPKAEGEEIPEVEEEQVPGPVESEAEEITPDEPIESLEEETEEVAAAEPEAEETEEEAESEEAEIIEEDRDKEKVYDEYEREILYEAINSSISQEVSEDQEPEKSTNLKEGEETKVEVEATEEREKEVQTSATPTSFSEWLRKRADEIHYNEKAGVEKPSAPVEEIEKSESAQEGLEEAKPSQDELIEQFIEREPKITPKKADMFSSENLAKMSVVEDESFVTETMAKIFAKQGNIRKAKRAYKLLSLKYPEKSIYFANQIKKLQGKK